MPPILRWTAFLALIGAGVFFWITAPGDLTPDARAALGAAPADLERGEQVFWAAGCASCHIAPEAEKTDTPLLAGGQPFKTQFGTFHAPNISPDLAAGIGSWSLEDFALAVQKGVAPDGSHYYPAFPYTSYVNASSEDVAALYAFMQTLPAVATPSRAHEVGFPFNIRRTLGGWKFLFAKSGWVVEPTETERGRYLVEALGHCGECHTPRNALGGIDYGSWLAGGPNPNGAGKIPGLTPATLDWSAEDIAYYLETGFTPDFDSAGGHMVAVVENMARLTPEDRAAIAAYLKALP